MNSFYNRYYRYYIPNIQKLPYIEQNNSNNDNSFKVDISNKEKSSRYSSFGPIHFKNPLSTNLDEPIFEVFGIELYLDDIIILGLLFFLYNEGVQDEMLFIALILLLLS